MCKITLAPPDLPFPLDLCPCYFTFGNGRFQNQRIKPPKIFFSINMTVKAKKMEIKNFNQLNLNKLYTYSDYITWKFEERVELIKGKVYKMASPSYRHQEISSNLHYIFYDYLKNKPCKVFAAPFDVRLPIPKGNKAYTVVQPDLCIICDESKTDKRGAIDAPDLVIEIVSLSNSKRDLKDKFQIYQEAGVKEYWVIQPNEKIVFVYILNEEGKYIGLKPFTEDDSIQSVTFEGLEFDLKNLFDKKNGDKKNGDKKF